MWLINISVSHFISPCRYRFLDQNNYTQNAVVERHKMKKVVVYSYTRDIKLILTVVLFPNNISYYGLQINSQIVCSFIITLFCEKK